MGHGRIGGIASLGHRRKVEKENVGIYLPI